MPYRDSQLQVVYSDMGEKCIVYREDQVTKTHDGGLQDMNKECKEVWIYPNNDNTDQYPVRLILKYLSLCPQTYFKKENFYLQSLKHPTPTQWYGGQVVGQNTLGKVIKEMMKSAEIDGYFTNHSARRTGSTHLFQGGISRKLVKEATGHCSDAVDKYQETSDAQHREMSNIIATKPHVKVTELPQSVKRIESCETMSKAEPDVSVTLSQAGEINASKTESDSGNIGVMINDIISSAKKGSKTKIKIEIEICNE